MDTVKQQREWMKAHFDKMDNVQSDQQLQKPQPPLQKPYNENNEVIDLPEVNESILTKTNIFDIFTDRVSHRKFTDESISLEELSFLLWASQGVKDIKGDNYCTMRTVPSAGARHPFETYIVVNRVEGLKSGVYRYLALTHQLACVFEKEDLEEKIAQVTLGQKFAGKSAVTFVWSVVPYRGEWRYSVVAHKPMVLDAGHVCQNLYLACEAIGCGTCAIAAYDQKEIDEFLNLDGEDEFVIYVSPVGKI
ncbi:SagB/ThcOx family dehydrogenase [Oceanirhabdus seepicola]|uniref:SagB/ThcOx family dehydrogenase n=1 Tax=Oceanirhabdus seepicola TaxID=2828781 RepID=A0A9J6P0P6_9CLOT|nr:SagB/ThcOx family dehydrogenase [Oceanirhabdus seepicola]MCM1989032.1 SagB/ThcOx family dehydrogenase [Oceanirhabdus seepicola]